MDLAPGQPAWLNIAIIASVGLVGLLVLGLVLWFVVSMIRGMIGFNAQTKRQFSRLAQHHQALYIKCPHCGSGITIDDQEKGIEAFRTLYREQIAKVQRDPNHPLHSAPAWQQVQAITPKDVKNEVYMLCPSCGRLLKN